jgi:hypothetical protein
LVPGSYYIFVTPSIGPQEQLTFTVPAGWHARPDRYVLKNEGTPGEVNFSSDGVTHVYEDACHSAGTLKAIGPTVDDLVRALVDQRGSQKSAPVDVTLGGHPAKRIDVSIPADLDTATCRIDGIQIWADPAETDFFAMAANPTGAATVYVVDIEGTRAVAIIAAHATGASPADVAELDAILASMQIEP